MKVKLPEPYATIINEVCARDCQYFEQHPGIKSYVRPSVKGEFYPLPIVAKFVIVHRVAESIRIREPLEEFNAVTGG